MAGVLTVFRAIHKPRVRISISKSPRAINDHDGLRAENNDCGVMTIIRDIAAGYAASDNRYCKSGLVSCR